MQVKKYLGEKLTCAATQVCLETAKNCSLLQQDGQSYKIQ